MEYIFYNAVELFKVCGTSRMVSYYFHDSMLLYQDPMTHDDASYNLDQLYFKQKLFRAISLQLRV